MTSQATPLGPSRSKTIAEKNTYLFLRSLAEISTDFLRRWAAEEGCSIIHLYGRADLTFYRMWNRCADHGGIGILVDYPLSDRRDLDTLGAFVKFVKRHPGQWYYAPRPNDYVKVSGAALVGLNPIVPFHIGHGLAQKARELGGQVLSLPWFPAGLSGPLRKLGSHIFTSKEKRYRAKPSHAEEPQGAVPENLPHLPAAGWQPWRPDMEILKHDLVERGEVFFPHPSSIHVILLNKCNLKCVMCPYHSTRYTPHHTSPYFRNLKSMSEETFKGLVEYAAKHHASLYFGQIEEPLLHRKVFDFVKMAKEAGVPHLHMTTNGTLLDRRKADRLSQTGIDSVMFSLDAASPEVYEAIRGSRLSELEEKLLYFLPLAKKHAIQVAVSFIMQPGSIHERDEFLERWQRMGVDSVTFYVLTEHDERTGAMMRTAELYDRGERYPCASPWTQAVVFPDGEVSLCCKTMIEVGWKGVVSAGDLRRESFGQIWRGERYRALRRELLDNRFREFQVCADCLIWSGTTYVVEEHPGCTRAFNDTMDTYTFHS